MSMLILLTRMAGMRVAVRADAIDAVVPLPTLVIVPGAPRGLAGLATLRSRVLTVIDTAAIVDPAAAPAPLDQPGRRGLLLHAGGHAYALIVDQVGDARMVDRVEPVCRPPAPGWHDVARGMVRVPSATPARVSPAASSSAPSVSAADGPSPDADRPDPRLAGDRHVASGTAGIGHHPEGSDPYMLVDPLRFIDAVASASHRPVPPAPGGAGPMVHSVSAMVRTHA